MWWGHKAEKATWFYIVGVAPADMPPIPLVLGEATHVVQSRKRQDYRPHITKAEREHTPPELAAWLVEVARRCRMRMTHPKQHNDGGAASLGSPTDEYFRNLGGMASTTINTSDPTPAKGNGFERCFVQNDRAGFQLPPATDNKEQ